MPEFLSIEFMIKLGLTILLAVIGAIWWEIRSLRKVRHEDREAITRSKADIDILSHDYKRLVDRTMEENEDLKREVSMLRFMLKQAGHEQETTQHN